MTPRRLPSAGAQSTHQCQAGPGPWLPTGRSLSLCASPACPPAAGLSSYVARFRGRLNVLICTKPLTRVGWARLPTSSLPLLDEERPGGRACPSAHLHLAAGREAPRLDSSLSPSWATHVSWKLARSSVPLPCLPHSSSRGDSGTLCHVGVRLWTHAVPPGQSGGARCPSPVHRPESPRGSTSFRH